MCVQQSMPKTNGTFLPEGERNPKETLKNYLKKIKALFMFTEDTLDLLQNIFCPEEERFTVTETSKNAICTLKAWHYEFKEHLGKLPVS